MIQVKECNELIDSLHSFFSLLQTSSIVYKSYPIHIISVFPKIKEKTRRLSLFQDREEATLILHTYIQIFRNTE